MRLLRRQPVLVAGFLGGIVAIALFTSASLFGKAQGQRKASCEATITALQLTRETALAGIRIVSATQPPDGIPESLRKAFAAQAAATKAENARRADVATRAQQAIDDLRSSPFCQ